MGTSGILSPAPVMGAITNLAKALLTRGDRTAILSPHTKRMREKHKSDRARKICQTRSKKQNAGLLGRNGRAQPVKTFSIGAGGIAYSCSAGQASQADAHRKVGDHWFAKPVAIVGARRSD